MTARIIMAGVLLRVVVAAWNGFSGPSFGADGDAQGLHDMAVVFADQGAPSRIHVGYLYAYLLGGVYRVTIPSLFLGSLLSCLAWVVSAFTLRATMELLQHSRAQQARALICFAMLPSSVLWTAITIREPHQLLAVNIAIYAALKIYLGGTARLKYWALLLAAVTFGAVMHSAILGWGVLLTVATGGGLLYRRRRSIAPAHMVVVMLCLIAVLSIGYRVFTSVYQYPVDRGLAFAVESYQRGGLSIGVRTDYRTSVTLQDTVDLLFFLPVSLLQYFFEPLPWRVSSLLDLALLLENMLRALLIVSAASAVWYARPARRRSLLLVGFAYLVLETAFSVGTFNWGTAARHHIPGFGLLLMVAFALPDRTPRTVGTYAVTAGDPKIAA